MFQIEFLFKIHTISFKGFLGPFPGFCLTRDGRKTKHYLRAEIVNLYFC